MVSEIWNIQPSDVAQEFKILFKALKFVMLCLSQHSRSLIKSVILCRPFKIPVFVFTHMVNAHEFQHTNIWIFRFRFSCTIRSGRTTWTRTAFVETSRLTYQLSQFQASMQIFYHTIQSPTKLRGLLGRLFWIWMRYSMIRHHLIRLLMMSFYVRYYFI